MAATRIQRQTSRLLDEAEKAVQERDWDKVLSCAQDALTLDPGKVDAQVLLAAAKRALGISPAGDGATHGTIPTADRDDASKLLHDGVEADPSGELYRIVAENMAEGVSIAVDGKREYVNKAFLDIYGLDRPSQAIGKGVDLLVAPEDRQRVRERAPARLLGAQIPPVVEYRIIRPDGDARLVEANIALINYRGRPGVVALIRDITAVKEVEDALRQSEELYRSVAENMMDGISINVDDKRVYVNPAFLNIFGLTDVSQATGMPMEANFAPEDQRDLKDRLKVRRMGGVLPQRERRVIRPDGEVRIIDTLASLITYSGAPARLVVFRDITDRKQAEKALERSEDLYRSVAENMMDGISINVDDKRV